MSPDALTFTLRGPEETLRFGAFLAKAVPSQPPYPAVLLDGNLGAGKTTLVRGLVETLPGGEEAEVASPSFNLMNLYPTRPEVAHFDLYRLEQASCEGCAAMLDADLEEELFREDILRLVEWARFLPHDAVPDDTLAISLSGRGKARQTGDSRTVSVEARGQAAEAIRNRLRRFGADTA